jgi:hypothetical protein
VLDALETSCCSTEALRLLVLDTSSLEATSSWSWRLVRVGVRDCGLSDCRESLGSH